MAGGVTCDTINGHNIAGGFFGIGQTLSSFTTTERADNVTYTNDTGRAITFMCYVHTNIAGNTLSLRFYTDNTLVQQVGTYSHGFSFAYIIPAGSTYRYLLSNSSIFYIHELR
jgi:hypothetical protein